MATPSSTTIKKAVKAPPPAPASFPVVTLADLNIATKGQEAAFIVLPDQPPGIGSIEHVGQLAVPQLNTVMVIDYVGDPYYGSRVARYVSSTGARSTARLNGALRLTPATREAMEHFGIDADAVERATITSKIASSKHHLTIGCDPEIFAVNAKGELLPAFEYLPAKDKASLTGAYWDGYQGEFSPHADTCLQRLSNNIVSSLKYMRSRLPKGASLTLKNTFDIPMERLKSDKDQFVNFGCSPSFSAYDEEVPKLDARSVSYRSAGGHIHFSYSGEVRKAVKALDLVLGVISVAMFQYYDDPRRRLMYGRAGEYRTPHYGFEYRVLSNAWLCHPAVYHFTYDLARTVLGQVAGKSPLWKLWDVTEAEARECINRCDVKLAQQLLLRNERGLEALILALPGVAYAVGSAHSVDKDKAVTAWKRLVFNGVHTALRKPDELSTCWGLGNGLYQGPYNEVQNATPMLARTGRLED